MSAVLLSTPRIREEQPLPNLVSCIARDCGWIMEGGSAQFRQGALTELQASLREVRERVANERVLRAVTMLGDKALQVATRNLRDAETILGLGRILGEFEQAMKAHIATLPRR